MLLVFSGVFTFLVDAYAPAGFAASALAANSFARSSFAAAFPLFGVQSEFSHLPSFLQLAGVMAAECQIAVIALIPSAIRLSVPPSQLSVGHVSPSWSLRGVVPLPVRQPFSFPLSVSSGPKTVSLSLANLGVTCSRYIFFVYGKRIRSRSRFSQYAQA